MYCSGVFNGADSGLIRGRIEVDSSLLQRPSRGSLTVISSCLAMFENV
jgi:hypothetical protein